jgi:hypothetical protein
MFQDIGNSLSSTTTAMAEAVGMFVPKLVVALILILITWIAARWIAAAVQGLLKWTRLDEYVKKSRAFSHLHGRGLEVKPSEWIAKLLKWTIWLIMLISIAEVLGLTQIVSFLDQVILYIPNVIVAIIIIVLGIIFGDVFGDVVTRIVNASTSDEVGTGAAATAGMIARWALYVFAGLAALIQLGIAEDLIKILVTGIIFAIALALGLSFGMGGQDWARKEIEEMRRKVKRS